MYILKNIKHLLPDKNGICKHQVSDLNLAYGYFAKHLLVITEILTLILPINVCPFTSRAYMIIYSNAHGLLMNPDETVPKKSDLAPYCIGFQSVQGQNCPEWQKIC